MNILLAEDDAGVAANLLFKLAHFSHKVAVAENGQLAFQRFCKARPDLVLMDIQMPSMNGFEATRKIRAHERSLRLGRTPIIYLTSSPAPENIVMAVELDGDDYLVKDAQGEIVQAKIRSMEWMVAARQQLEQSNQDTVTGLPNRHGMDDRVNEAWADCVGEQQPFALLLLAVNHFRSYNDHFGRQIGNDCLCAIAQAVKEVVDEANAKNLVRQAFAARYSGEELAIVLPYAARAAEEQIALEIIAYVEKLAIQGPPGCESETMTISIGGSRINAATGEIANLFRDAAATRERAGRSAGSHFESSTS